VVILAQFSGKLIGQALNPVSFCMVAAGAQLLGPAAPVPESAVGGAASAPLLVGPQPGAAAMRPADGKLVMQTVHSGRVVHRHRNRAGHDDAARRQLRVLCAEPSQRGGRDTERVGDLSPEVELARECTNPLHDMRQRRNDDQF
jgi:hypothetical protein